MDIKTTKEQKVQSQEFVHDEKTHRAWFVTYLVLGIICVGIYLLLKIQFFGLLGKYRLLFERISLAGFCVLIILTVTKGIELILIKRSHAKAITYNVVRLIRLISVVIALLVIISFLFQNWYTAAVSVGLFSLVVGFALQTPISSLIGWFYIIIRSPYKVGDRIQITNFTGDVVEISYLDTTLWEFAGDYLTNDLPSGRVIRFPNTLVLQSQVYNYSWKKFPYIWNEIPFHIAYDSDFVFVESTMKSIATKQLGERMAEKVERYKNLLKRTPIDEFEIKEYPFVTFRINANTWVEVLLIYLVEPKRASAMRTQLIKAIIAELNKSPDKVKFPKGDSR